MSKQILVSVLINSYNGDKFIEKSIQSVLDQSLQNFEIIFWDNCSKDSTQSKIKLFNDPRIKYYLSSEHTSQYEARKQAILKCNAELIAILDVDDWWDSKKLEKQTKLFSDKKIGFSCTNAWIVNERKNKNKKLAFKLLPNGSIINELLKKNFITMSSLMIRKESYLSLEYGFNPAYEIIGDFDLAIRLALQNQFASLQEPLTYYRQHENNLTFVKIEKNIRELIDFYKVIKINPEINKNKYFNIFKNNIIFSSALLLILENKRFLAMKKIFLISSILHLLKLLIVLSLPKKIIRKIRSR